MYIIGREWRRPGHNYRQARLICPQSLHISCHILFGTRRKILKTRSSNKYLYWFPSFPGLARNTVALRLKADEYNAGNITREEYDMADSMKRNELSNMALYISGIGEIVILAISVAILYGIHTRASAEQNNWGLSTLIAFGSAAWLILAIPWFVLEKRRPGQPVPMGKNLFSASWWQLQRAATQIWKLKQSLAFLIGRYRPPSPRPDFLSPPLPPFTHLLGTECWETKGYFFLGDSLNTTVTIVQTLQNEVQAYDTIQLAYLLMTGLAAQTMGVYTFWSIQRRRSISTRTMFNVVVVAIILLDCWGMLGIWTQKFGFHHRWEFWM